MNTFAAVIVAAGLPEPVEEFRFHLTRRWRFDLAFPEHMLAVEIDGGLYVHGRHSQGKGREADLEKLAEAMLLGWRVLTVSPRQVRDGRALAWVTRAIRERVKTG